MHAGQDATTELGVAWGHRAAEGGFEIYTNTSRRTRATRPPDSGAMFEHGRRIHERHAGDTERRRPRTNARRQRMRRPGQSSNARNPDQKLVPPRPGEGILVRQGRTF